MDPDLTAAALALAPASALTTTLVAFLRQLIPAIDGRRRVLLATVVVAFGVVAWLQLRGPNERFSVKLLFADAPIVAAVAFGGVGFVQRLRDRAATTTDVQVHAHVDATVEADGGESARVTTPG